MSNATADSTAASTGFNPVRALLNLFSSVRFGITLLVILFVYCSLGSAGILYPVSWNIFDSGNWRHEFIRTWRAFELTEFEWFHTWFFDAVIFLIAANIFVTTIRRIPLTILSAGVWCIHSGIIILCIGSVIYFGTKVEGDTPVIRRAVTINFPGQPPVSMPAMPGASASVRTPEGDFTFEVSQVQPDWPIITEPDKGKTAYSVNVLIRSPERQFIRQLLAGYPKYTEDIIPGVGRAVKNPDFLKPIIDERFTLALEALPQDTFWVTGTNALYARDAGTRAWVERPIKGIPKYNDYVASPGDVIAAGESAIVSPLNIAVPASSAPNDPLAGAQVRITGYLRYADLRAEFTGGSKTFNPLVDFTLTTAQGTTADGRVVADDPELRSGFRGEVEITAVGSEAEAAALATPSPNKLVIRVPKISDEFPGGQVNSEFTKAEVRAAQQSPPPADVPSDSPSLMRAGAEFTPIPGSPFSFRVRDVVDRLPLQTGESVALAVVEFKTPEKTFQRWVFADSTRNRDMPVSTDSEDGDPHTTREADPRIVTEYEPKPRPTLMLVAVRETGKLYSITEDAMGALARHEMGVGKSEQIREELRLTVTNYITDARQVLKPVIIPRQQRDKDIDTAQLASLYQLEITENGESQSLWLPFHAYAVEDVSLADVNMGRFAPLPIELPSGRRVEVMMSRERRPLPAPVILNDFILTSHVGGYTGTVSSIRDWTSVVSFKAESGLTEPTTVSTNAPASHDGLWFFQKTWDPQGLRFTGLGVGNREGVYTQLAGCCISVVGMLYAFYVKPIIRRRRIQRVHEQVARDRAARDTAADQELPHINGSTDPVTTASRIQHAEEARS